MDEIISFGKVDVGEGLPSLIIAEIGLNHNGDVNMAHKLVEEAALSGANMVKFQKRTPDALAIKEYLDLPFTKCPQLGRTQRQVREQLELTFDEMKALKSQSESLGLIFTTSVFDIPSLNFAVKLEVDILKIASHSITNGELLSAVNDLKFPSIVSIGGAKESEYQKAMEILKDTPIILMHCVSSYPCPDHEIYIDSISMLSEKYGKIVGYSGHEPGSEACIAAVTLGAKAIEKHFTLNKNMSGLDHRISMEPDEFSEMVRGIRRIERMRGIKSEILDTEYATRNKYHVAICAKNDIPVGHTITRDDITFKQPLVDDTKHFTGLEMRLVLGSVTNEVINSDTQIKRSSLN